MPGVKQQVLAAGQRVVDGLATESPGWATKKSTSGHRACRRSGPAAQVVPLESWRGAGTKTLPRAGVVDVQDTGFSRLTGVVGRVVYGPPQDACGGEALGRGAL